MGKKNENKTYENLITMLLRTTAGKLIALVFGKLNIVFHEESFILAEKTQSAGIANSLTGDTLGKILMATINITTKNSKI